MTKEDKTNKTDVSEEKKETEEIKKEKVKKEVDEVRDDEETSEKEIKKEKASLKKEKAKKTEKAAYPGFVQGMTTIWKKELMTFFYSPAAYIILGGFVILTSWLFFGSFWVRNEADVRALFSNLPLIFLIITPLITMKMWAEERASGTQDQLFSLPVSLAAATLGKFSASMTIIVTALLFTLPYPIIAEYYGNLDWGPVWGGYIAAFLLGGAYVSIGLFLSSLTRTQIEAAFLTIFIAGFLYFIGEPFFTAQTDSRMLYDFMLKIGLGSRFRSIARGVLDIRDLVYYLSVTSLFVMLNISVLKHRKWL